MSVITSTHYRHYEYQYENWWTTTHFFHCIIEWNVTNRPQCNCCGQERECKHDFKEDEIFKCHCCGSFKFYFL